MADRKKQHYVPQFYMKQFADKDKKFAVYVIDAGKTIPSAPYKSQCCRDYLYGDDAVWEEKLGLMESEWARAIKDASSSESPSEKSFALLKQFALFQRQRTVAELEYRNKEHREHLEEIAKSVCHHRGAPSTQTK